MEGYRKGEHPGQYIRRELLPKRMSVTGAAELLGVSRPTLSNLLNGKASLSPEMALRLEKAFGAKKEALLQIQAAYDNAELQANEPSVAVRAYVPSFLEITARQISSWADQIVARSLLPVLLRRLVVTTTEKLEKADFPGYDNAQRTGWDGQVQTDSPTPWVPPGFSGWEFGCDQNARRKAEDDYQARTQSVPKEERMSTTFVFVTPRNWPGKEAWVKEKLTESQWKGIRAFDASDLEQWLEQSVPTQSWMSEKLGVDRTGILSLDEAWEEWAKVTKPQLSKTLFKSAVELHRDKLTKWLGEPPETPFVIAADSKGEALAFLACLLESVSTPQNAAYERAVVLNSSEAFRKISVVSKNFVAIVASGEVESALAGTHRTRHTIILRHREISEDDPEVSLDLVDDKTFEQGLLEMGIPHEDVRAYARESGQSITVLRRRLAQIPAIRSPEWAQDNKLSRSLIPLWMVGAWDSQKKADQEVVSFLTGRDYPDIDQSITELLALPDSPLWAAGRHRGVVSKIDVLFVTHHLITKPEFERFLSRSQVVLAEKDPALELPEDKRWMAAIYEKTRNHSPALRRSMCDSLVLLAVYGGRLLDTRLSANVEQAVNAVIRKLLTPLTPEILASQQSDLPYYAEAAPDAFLDILEEDLKTKDPAVMSLMVPADSGLLGGGCPRTGLLWALELLAWKPERLPRVASILARLSQRKIDDNWANKPEASLAAILRAEMPQTAATIEERSTTLELIARKFPDVGWRLCMEEFARGGRFGMYSYRPRWRKDAVGAGHILPHWGLIRPYKEKALEIATRWPSHNANTLGDLVERLNLMPEDYQKTVWRLIRDWAATAPSETEKASLKEHIRRFAFTRHGRNRKVTEETKRHAQEAQALLEPADLVARHTWLFEKQWVEESLEEFEDKKFDYHRREAKIGELRRVALEEIWQRLGYEGVMRLSEIGDAATTVGWVLADILNAEESIAFAGRLCSESSNRNTDALFFRFLHNCKPEVLSVLLSALIEQFSNENEASEEKTLRLLSAAPVASSTWSRLSKLPKELQRRYWQEVHPGWNRQNTEELRLLIDRLLEVGRPRAAFHAVHFELEKIDTTQLMQLLRTMPLSAEPMDHYRFNSHDIEEAFSILDSRSDVNMDDLAPLEFTYLELLGRSKRGIPQLERQLAKSPALFVQAIAMVFKRKDGGVDPPEWNLEAARQRDIGTQAYRMLHDMRRLPGTQDDGKIDKAVLKDWISQVRALCASNAREEVGDSTIGELLAKSPEGKDGIWPCEEVRDVLEDVGTTNIARGMSIGRRNARGVQWRDVGGKQERELATKYRGWSRKLSFDWPFTARLLEDLAKNYDHEAKWYDVDETVNKRLKD